MNQEAEAGTNPQLNYLTEVILDSRQNVADRATGRNFRQTENFATVEHLSSVFGRKMEAKNSGICRKRLEMFQAGPARVRKNRN